jgi:ribosome-binding factor A
MTHPRTIAKLEARIHERAAHCIDHEVRDPRAPFITITRVELSNDIASAKIFYSVLGTPADRSKAEHMLASAGGFIQRQVARVLETRRVPHLSWIYDESVAEAAHLSQVIHEALERDKKIAETHGHLPPLEPKESDWKKEYDEFAEESDADVPPKPDAPE